MTSTTTDREIIVTRVIDAPADLVFAAFTELEHARNWWVPGGTEVHEYNAQPGGLWRYSQPGPGGAEYSFKIKFIEIDPPTHLVYDFGTDAEDAGEPVRTNVTFEEQDGKTKVTLQLVFPSVAEFEQAKQYGAARGARMALDNVANYLTQS